jgi:hypothetical protein
MRVDIPALATFLLAVSALTILALQNAKAQQADILEASPPTALYVETAYEGNDDLQHCDWYTPVSKLIDANVGDQSHFGRDCAINIRMRGIINQEGAALFLRLVERLQQTGHRPTAIILNSKGGDADAAIAIGQAIRSNEIFQLIPGGVETRISEDETATCFSACVVIFAAGYRRSAEFYIHNNPQLPSRLGIHGPGHFDEKSSRYDTSANNQQLIRINRALKSYFAGIDINESLVDDMFAVPFNEIRLLKEEDLADYGIKVN